MKIKCPKCESVYEIAEAKIPEKGANVTCKKCQNRFAVKRREKMEEQSEEKVQQGETKQIIITCPDCGHVNISKKSCVGCGRAFSEDEISELKIEI